MFDRLIDLIPLWVPAWVVGVGVSFVALCFVALCCVPALIVWLG